MINQNLETIAKQLYDYWFVQFEFPDENGNPYKSSGGEMVWSDIFKRDIPKHWQTTTISKFAKVSKGSLITEKECVLGNIKVVAAGVDFSYFHNKSNRCANVITISASGANAGHVNYWREPIFASDCTTVQCDDVIDTLLCLYNLKLLQERLYSIAQGSAQPHVYPNQIDNLPIIIIPDTIKAKITDFLTILHSQIGKNQIEITNLMKMRDKLLPLLMNGQVFVNSDLSYCCFLFRKSIAQHKKANYFHSKQLAFLCIINQT